MRYYSIAVDGPAGAGKSTIAKRVAKELDFVYIDTGAMYRAMGLFFKRNGISSDDENTIREKCDDIDISIFYNDGQQHVVLNGEDVTGYIRTQEIGDMASAISVYSFVRAKLVRLQQKLAMSSNVIMDGRDIGSVVLPNADLKIYLTASSKERAKRRAEELEAKGLDADIEQIEREIIERDYRDMHRENSPLVCVPDAVTVDSSDMSIDEVTQKLIGLFKECM